MVVLLSFALLILIHLLGEGRGTELNSLHFGTKTAYYYDKFSSVSLQRPENCTPVHIEFVSRHGSRFPSKGDMKNIDKLLTKLNGVYTANSSFRLKNLTLPWTKWTVWNDAETKELSPRGELEQYTIAKRLRSNFAEVFDKPYWNKYYKFIARDKRRTAQSAMAFALGLFENSTKQSQGISRFKSVAIKSAGPEEKDKLLSSYDACPRYVADADKNPLPEVDKFADGPEMRNVIRKFERRLRINGTTSLTFKDVDVIRRLCAFGIMNQEDDSWCALLDSESSDVINYVEDLTNFYEHSFGNELGYKIICVLLTDIIENLEDFSKGSSEARGVFRFASSGTIFALLTALGAYDNGTTLTASNFQPNSSRRFPSGLVPMSANIAFVLYKCERGEQQKVKHDNKVQILINEKPVGLPCCQGNITCSLGEFLAYFKHTVDNCDFDAMCAQQKDISTTPKALGLVNRPELLLLTLEVLFATFKMLSL